MHMHTHTHRITSNNSVLVLQGMFYNPVEIDFGPPWGVFHSIVPAGGTQNQQVDAVTREVRRIKTDYGIPWYTPCNSYVFYEAVLDI